jgi:hypothetical protein
MFVVQRTSNLSEGGQMATGSQPPIVAPPPATEPFAGRWLALPVVLVAMFMAQFDLYVVNV